MVEGPRCEAGFDNGAANRSGILHHVGCCNSVHLHSEFLDHLIAEQVMLRLRLEVVNLTIDFNDELGGWTVEIRDVGTDGVLTARFDASWRAAEELLQDRFRRRHRAPKSLRRRHRIPSGSHGPSTMSLRAMVPLPIPDQVPGQGGANFGETSSSSLLRRSGEGDRRRRRWWRGRVVPTARPASALGRSPHARRGGRRAKSRARSRVAGRRI